MEDQIESDIRFYEKMLRDDEVFDQKQIFNQESLLQKKKEFDQQCEELQQKLDQFKYLQDQYQYIKLKERQVRLQEVQQYDKPDFAIKIKKSLTELKDGLEVFFKKDDLIWKNNMRKKAKVVGFLGGFKAGKTYIASCISGKNLQHDIQIKTEGLNFILGEIQEDSAIYYLDSPGSGEPQQIFDGYSTEIQGKRYYYLDIYKKLQNSKNRQLELTEEEREAYTHFSRRSVFKERFDEQTLQSLTTEKFISNFVMTNCQVIIMVVGKMNSQTQLQINHIQQLIKIKKHKHRKLVVIHNFYEFFSEPEIDRYIQKDIKNCHNVFEQNIKIKNTKKSTDPQNPVYYEESKIWIDKNQSYDSTGNENPVIHLVMCNDTIDERISSKYNDFTIDFLKELIRNQNCYEKYDIFKLVKLYFENTFQRYIRVTFDPQHENLAGKKLKVKFEELKDDDQNLKEDPKNPRDRINYNYRKLVCPQLPQKISQYQFLKLTSLLSQGANDQIFTKEINPNYNIYAQEGQSLVVFDCPLLDKYSLSIKVNEKFKYQLILKGEKKFPDSYSASLNNERFNEYLLKTNESENKILTGRVYQEVEITDSDNLVYDIKDGDHKYISDKNDPDAGYLFVRIRIKKDI